MTLRNKRPLKIMGGSILVIGVLLGLGVLLTWMHWWWPVSTARVWIDGRLSPQVRVFRGTDGRYLIYYPNSGRNIMAEDITPGNFQAVDKDWAVPIGAKDWTQSPIVVFPFGAYSRSRCSQCGGVMYGMTDVDRLLHFRREPNGFSYINEFEVPIESVMSVPAQYRVKLR